MNTKSKTALEILNLGNILIWQYAIAHKPMKECRNNPEIHLSKDTDINHLLISRPREKYKLCLSRPVDLLSAFLKAVFHLKLVEKIKSEFSLVSGEVIAFALRSILSNSNVNVVVPASSNIIHKVDCRTVHGCSK